MRLRCQINEREVIKEIEPDLLLIDFVRQLGLKSVKRGCDTANCGLCTVWVEEVPVLSCAMLAARVNGKKVTTLEGVLDKARVLGAFIADQGAEQCGYCSPGFMMMVLAMEKELAGQKEDPDEAWIKHYLSGNLCRCSGYQGQLRAVTAYLKYRKKEAQNETG